MQAVLRVKFSDLNRFWVSFQVVNLEAKRLWWLVQR
jgi:hypothetical protein